ncbi:tubulin polyglutamylase TTLL1 [Pycnococcus provasolii]
MPLTWRSDFDKFVVHGNFARRGWLRWSQSDGEENWNVYWANIYTVKAIFHPDNGYRLGDHQVVNHFPNHYELTRKDLMVKNIKRYRRELEREIGAKGETAMATTGGYGPYASHGSPLLEQVDFIPLTFVLPSDYSLFVEEFKANSSRPSSASGGAKNLPNTWIAKPTSRSQGRGIFLMHKFAQLKRWASSMYGVTSGRPTSASMYGSTAAANRTSVAGETNGATTGETYVVSAYIDNPLLVGGRKFDLRVYVAVLSFRPLKAYIARKGFARFCGAKYTNDVSDLDNSFVHLTNNAVQKHGENYNDEHGNKWPLSDLKLWLEARYGRDRTNHLFADIDAMVVHSLKACQNVMINDKHCFELYGYDIIVSDTLKPWLIEVNASPSLACSDANDRKCKLRVINDTLSAVVLHRMARDAAFADAVVGGGETEKAPAPAPPLSTSSMWDEACSGSAWWAGKQRKLRTTSGAMEHAPATIGCLDLLVDDTNNL